MFGLFFGNNPKQRRTKYPIQNLPELTLTSLWFIVGRERLDDLTQPGWGCDRKHLFLGWGDFSHGFWGPQTINPTNKNRLRKPGKCVWFLCFYFSPFPKTNCRNWGFFFDQTSFPHELGQALPPVWWSYPSFGWLVYWEPPPVAWRHVVFFRVPSFSRGCCRWMFWDPGKCWDQKVVGSVVVLTPINIPFVGRS